MELNGLLHDFGQMKRGKVSLGEGYSGMLAYRRRARSLLGLWRCKEGTAAIEYAVMAGMLSAALLAAMAALGNKTGATYASVSTALEGAPDIPSVPNRGFSRSQPVPIGP